jgi:hypothetical protein
VQKICDFKTSAKMSYKIRGFAKVSFRQELLVLENNPLFWTITTTLIREFSCWHFSLAQLRVECRTLCGQV